MKESYKRAMTCIHADPKFRAGLLQTLSNEQQEVSRMHFYRRHPIILTATSVAALIIISVCIYAFAPFINNNLTLEESSSASSMLTEQETVNRIVGNMNMVSEIVVESDNSIIKDDIIGDIHVVSEVLY